MTETATSAERTDVLRAWEDWLQNGYLQAGHLRSLGVVSRPALAEIVYHAFCAAWVSGREALSQQVRELHSEFRIYDECDHDHTDEDVEQGRAVDTPDFRSCDEVYMYSICAHCCTEPEYGQTETCAGDHNHRPGAPLCPTLALLAEEVPVA